MVSLMSLWLPVVLSAVLVFVASTLLHVVLPFHRGDMKQLPQEESALEALRKVELAPGAYFFPYAQGAEMGTPEMREKFDRGPVGTITVYPNGPPAMARNMVWWLIVCLLVGEVCAYLASRMLEPGAPYLSVFRLVGTVALMAYAMGEPVNAIWKGQPWKTTAKMMVDGVIYALLTAGVFGWLWPEA